MSKNKKARLDLINFIAKTIYPKLTPIVKSFLEIMVTSVLCESLFSQTGIIANELCNRLNPFLLEELTLLKENAHFK